ncbi:TRAP transporter substrate-binding protein [Ruegeria sp. HKCCD7318]|uniref:TRAP transporter substrate-binding protein n=1 Tax=Ruegeria sp. HKCCD7318 TaxID=2683014 RepID=UPI0014922B55|nr:TRAP transporter substrate-binding protein [Ruegeria sp. HKCCD7318]NOE33372.1 C4-dicarboxylate ABC transporter substrate-binding protein [Ruegeria sp. HKCCD7318]
MIKDLTKTLLVGLAVTAAGATTAAAQTTLRIQNHLGQSSPYGVAIQKFVEDVATMSDGALQIEMFYSSAVVPTTETFDAAKNGIIDCDMTNGGYQVGKNAAFQFVADTMGGYDTPLQLMSWIYQGGGREAINELYATHNMTYVGGHVGGHESLNSSRPLNGISDLENFKFRSPPGMESDIFASLGAKPVVMDFTEIVTALESGIIDGADASTLATNLNIGIYDVAKHTTYPGFHSMSADHLACRSDVWNALSDQHKTIIEVAEKALAMEVMMSTLIQNGEALQKLPEMGVTTYNWSEEDRATFRNAALAAWKDWGAKSPEAGKLVQSHVEFLQRIGLLE